MSKSMDTATLTALDACGCGAQAHDLRRRGGRVVDRKGKRFSDPGSEHGPSIKNPKVYEALKRKGYSKQSAAAISNAQV